jgi:hypothetical protein
MRPRRRHLRAATVLAFVATGCVDKAPPALWPEPPPPLLAEPIDAGEGGETGDAAETGAVEGNAPEDGAVRIDQ